MPARRAGGGLVDPSARLASRLLASKAQQAASSPKIGRRVAVDLSAFQVGPSLEETRALEKTRLCDFFLRGGCRRGAACSFAHGCEQLRPQPDLFRTQLCAGFATKGECAFGDRCRFAHSADEVRAPRDHVRGRGEARGGARTAEASPLGAGAGLASSPCGDASTGDPWSPSSHTSRESPAHKLSVDTQSAHVSRQTTMDCGSSSGGASDEEAEVAALAGPLFAMPIIIVKNTFIEVSLASPGGRASRRSASFPCESSRDTTVWEQPALSVERAGTALVDDTVYLVPASVARPR